MKSILSLAPQVFWTLLGIYVGLCFASTVTWWLIRSYPSKNFTELKLRIKSWWIIAGVFTIAILGTRAITNCFLAFVSFLALKEFLSLASTRRADRRVLFWAYLSIPVQYYFVQIGWYGMFLIFIPVYVFLFLPFRMVIVGETKGFLSAVGVLHWGLMITVFSISHLAYLLVLPLERNRPHEGAGLILFLVLLTELNDVFQFLWGKSLGRHKITPIVSPNKTVEGFLGGLVSTSILALILGPFLTPIKSPLILAVGPLISIGGFVGDIVISAIKRDIGVKDSGNLIPGHGGILDRIDSLTYTVPLFFYFMRYFYYQ